MAKLTKITGNYGFMPAKPVPAAVDNGDGTVTFTTPGVGGAAKVLLSYGTDEGADDVVVDITRDGIHTTSPYDTDTTLYFKAQTYSAGGEPSGWSAVDDVIVDVAAAATPEANPAAGAVAGGTLVTLTCETEGATIYYTLDGSDPDAESDIYTDPIEVTEPVTIKAFADREGSGPSAILSAAYTIVE